MRASEAAVSRRQNEASKDVASRFYTRYDDATYPITIHRMTQQGAAYQLSDGQLTAEQREALSRAVEAGYFDVPRRTTLVGLARELGISDTATSQRLRRGVATVLQDSSLALRETSNAARQDD
jgi:predicted DNA binding protein